MNRSPRHSFPGIAASSGQQGFTLLEILIAFVILAIGFTAVSTGIVLAMRSDERVQSVEGALLVAQSRLDAAGVVERLAPGHREGSVGSKYRWSQTMTEMQPASLMGKATQPGSAPVNVRTFWVTVAVESADGSRAQLSGLKAAAGAKP